MMLIVRAHTGEFVKRRERLEKNKLALRGSVQFIISEHTIIYFNHQRDLFRPHDDITAEKLNWNKRASLFTLLLVRRAQNMYVCAHT